LHPSFPSSKPQQQQREQEQAVAGIPSGIPSAPAGSDTRALVNYCLAKVFGFESFKGVQEQAIVAALDCERTSDVFVIMPTGGGKSLCYIIPALLRPGVTVVISPLLSLIQDQVSGLVSGYNSQHGLGVPACSLSSELSEQDALATLRELRKLPAQAAGPDGRPRLLNPHGPSCKLVFVTPEKVVGSASFHAILRGLYEARDPGTGRRMLSRFTVDECHCVSTWGHDWRKDYQKLDVLRRDFPEVPILALTATATGPVERDVISTLRMRRPLVFKQDFNRPNLIYTVRPRAQDRDAAFEQVARYIRSEQPAGASGIVYCLSRDDTEELAEYLRSKAGLPAEYYHAGMSAQQRCLVQMLWQRGRASVVCATIAMGMGIDKADVRYVVHFTLAKAVEGYYQESGRAGRDGRPAHVLLLYHPRDVVRVRRVIQMRQPGAFKSRASVAAALKKLDEMRQYCESSVAPPPAPCLRSALITYFGQTLPAGECQATCSVCHSALQPSSPQSPLLQDARIRGWLAAADPASGQTVADVLTEAKPARARGQAKGAKGAKGKKAPAVGAKAKGKQRGKGKEDADAAVNPSADLDAAGAGGDSEEEDISDFDDDLDNYDLEPIADQGEDSAGRRTPVAPAARPAAKKKARRS
jgi:bloom syndrome protein